MPANPRAPRLVEMQSRVARRSRNPQHQFNIRFRPFQMQPFLLAPVLPGETMKSLMIQARTVTDPLVSSLVGWWLEYYVFYVKHRDLDERDTLTQMVLDPNFNAAPLYSAASVAYYHQSNSINWASKCLKRVAQEYFRDQEEGDPWGHAIDALPVVQVNNRSWLDSVMKASTFMTPDIDVDSADANTTIQASEVEAALRQWEFMRYNNMTSMDYEDFLATYGVRPKAAEEHRPELIRYVREWSYPVNTVDPATGAPSSAMSWKVAERADKDRFFREPGFIFGICVARPKVYRKYQMSSVADYLDDAYGWLPAVLAGDPNYSWRPFAAATGPVPNQTAEYRVDVKDLYLYGDQFLNFDPTGAGANVISIPSPDMTNKRYASAADVDALFKAPASNLIRSDGVVQLSILGRQDDTSPRVA